MKPEAVDFIKNTLAQKTHMLPIILSRKVVPWCEYAELFNPSVLVIFHGMK